MRMSVLLSLVLLCTSLSSSHAQTILGLTTDNKIIGFDAIAPSQIVRGPLDITGIAQDFIIVGMDIRPSTGELYALTYHVQTMMARLYTIDINTGVATRVGAEDISLPMGDGPSSMDFNPVVDRIRVVSLTGKNFRLNPNTGALVATDTDVAYSVGDVNEGTLPMLSGIAYTNSYVAAEATSVYFYDPSLNTIGLLNPPNAGVLNTIGKTVVVFEQSQGRADIDIYFDPVARLNLIYLVTRDTGEASDGLYLVDPTTGGTTYLGQVPTDIADIAILIEKPPIEPVTGVLTYLLTKTSNRLLTIDSDNPTVIRSLVTISGVHSSFSIVGIDVRPADLRLYALGYNRATNATQLYIIEPTTGAALAVGDSTQTLLLGSGDVAVDWSPVSDRLRVIGAETRNNYRLDDLGALVATDTPVAYAPSDPNASIVPQIGSAAYTNNYAAAGTTTLFAVDDSVGSIVTINPANAGTMFTIAGHVFDPLADDRTSDIDFYYDSTDGNVGFLVVNEAPSRNDDLYRIGETGDAQRVGPIGLGTQIVDIAVQLSYVGDTTTSSVDEGKGLTTLRVSPNPVLEGATLVLPSMHGNGVLRVMDITGREVLRRAVMASDVNIYVPMMELPRGVYTLQISDASTTTSAQIIKQ